MMHGRESLGSAHFSELSLWYVFYRSILMQPDRSKMRLVPEAALSENDFIEGIPHVHILYRKSPIKIY
jgi:hypothetical protein